MATERSQGIAISQGFASKLAPTTACSEIVGVFRLRRRRSALARDLAASPSSEVVIERSQGIAISQGIAVSQGFASKLAPTTACSEIAGAFRLRRRRSALARDLAASSSSKVATERSQGIAISLGIATSRGIASKLAPTTACSEIAGRLAPTMTG